jgi:methyl-accepting chemotaxis protein
MGQAVSEGREDMASISRSLERIQRAVHETAARSEAIVQRAGAQLEEAERMAQDAERVAAMGHDGASAIEAVRAAIGAHAQAAVRVAAGATALGELGEELGHAARRFEDRSG